MNFWKRSKRIEERVYEYEHINVNLPKELFGDKNTYVMCQPQFNIPLSLGYTFTMHVTFETMLEAKIKDIKIFPLSFEFDPKVFVPPQQHVFADATLVGKEEDLELVKPLDVEIALQNYCKVLYPAQGWPSVDERPSLMNQGLYGKRSGYLPTTRDRKITI